MTTYAFVSEQQYLEAEAVVDAAGLQHKRKGDCLWCWLIDSKGHAVRGRYVDVLGLLLDPDPRHYALNAWQGGSA